MQMPLSNELRDVAIEFQCPACAHPTVKMGSWVRTIGSFKCDGCKAKVRIGYEHKLAMFERYMRKR
jgi:transposase-like protein